MAELECRADAWRKCLEKCLQQRQILLQVRWQLEEQRAQLRPQRRCRLEKRPDAIAAVPEPGIVRDALWRLQRQLETVRSGLAPAVDDLFRRCAIERVV